MTAVYDKYDGELISETAPEQDPEKLILKSERAFQTLGEMTNSDITRMFRKISEIMESRSRELALIITRETGKPLKFSLNDLEKAIQIFNFWAMEGGPYNSPDSLNNGVSGGVHRLSMTRFLQSAPVILVSNSASVFLETCIFFSEFITRKAPLTVVAPLTHPLAIMDLERIISEAGFPEGSFQVALGDGVLKKKPDWFSIVYSKNLYSDSHVVVFDDADLDYASGRIFDCLIRTGLYGGSMFRRIITGEKSHTYLINRISEMASSLVAGDPRDENTDILDSRRLVTETGAPVAIQSAIIEGGKIIFGDPASSSGILGLDFQSGLNRLLKSIEIPIPSFYFSTFRSFKEISDFFSDARGVGSISLYTSDLNMALMASDRLNFQTVQINDTYDPVLGFSSYSSPVLRNVFNGQGSEPWPLERWKKVVFGR